jgi:serine phosphatase RsbU (regulator of sigma subunit)/HAMP domain-containing protein
VAKQLRRTVSGAPSSLRFPIALKFAVLMTALVVAFMAWQTFTATRAAEERLDAEVNLRGILLATSLAATLEQGSAARPGDAAAIGEVLRRFLKNGGVAEMLDIVAYDSSGQMIVTATGRTAFVRTAGGAVKSAPADAAGVRIVEFEYERVPVRGFSTAFAAFPPGGAKTLTPGGRVDVIISAREIQESRDELAQAMNRVSVTACVFAALAAFLLAAWMARPIRRLLKDMTQVSLGNLDHKSKVQSSDELGDLARGFNTMTSGLKAAQEAKLAQREMEHELSLASRIQERLLPSALPRLPGFELERHYEPAKEVGGDYYDFIPIDADHLGVVVADVSGKGIPASLVMTMTRSLLRLAAKGEASPQRTIDRVHRALVQDLPSGMFVTLVYFVVDARNREARLVRAGHNPPIFWRAADSTLHDVRPRGLGIGIDREGSRFSAELALERIHFQPGDVLVTYSDGVVEAKNRKGAEYGLERLGSVVAANAEGGAGSLLAAVLRDVKSHVRDADPSDDVTIVVLRANP